MSVHRKPEENELGIPQERIYPIAHLSPGSEKYRPLDIDEL